MKNGLMLILFLLLCTRPVPASITLPKIFSDNMVLQQNAQVPIWGKAAPRSEVVVKTTWGKSVVKTVSKSNGSWKVSLKTPIAGGPYTISISDGSELILKNILLGEVWVCSGQSNMEMPVSGWGRIKNFEQEIAQADYPQIRLFQVEKNMSDIPLSDLKESNGSWSACSPKTVSLFSAVAYFYGRSLYKHLNVPIGLIDASWGGTPAEAWTSSEALKQLPAFSEEVREITTLNDDDQLKSFENKKQEWEKIIQKSDFGYRDGKTVANLVDYNDNDWGTMQLPNSWEDCGVKDFDGIAWFRKDIDIPQNWESKELVLSLGHIDDNDVTFFNGEKVGSTDGYFIDRVYRIPKELVKNGKNVITVRVTDNSGGGGLTGGREKMWISPKNGEASSIQLGDRWKYKLAVNLNELPVAPRNPIRNQNKPTVLFNAMIHPLIPFAIKGCIWYQGESNADRNYQAIQYRDLLPLLIRDWRNNWNRNLSFFYVQLANFKDQRNYPQESNWAMLRDAQLETLKLENTGMAVSIDIGEAYDIHPKNKQEVGNRLSLLARAITYKEKIEYSGPIFRGYTIEGNRIRIRFSHASRGLKANDGGPVKGFAIAGVDHQFHWADATIEGDEVVVTSSTVKFPVAVRYAWADNPDCNLYNLANLPASPFRTDAW